MNLRHVWWIVAAFAALALLSLWIVAKSPMDGSFKNVAKRTITTGASLAIMGFLGAVAFLGLPAPLGLFAAGWILAATGAWAVMEHAVAGDFDTPVCPPGAHPMIVDGDLWCSCNNVEGSVSLFPADSEPTTPCEAAG